MSLSDKEREREEREEREERGRREKNVAATLMIKPVPRQVVRRQVPSFKGVWFLQNLLSEEQCRSIIAASEAIGFGVTPYPKTYRGNTRVIIRDKMLAINLWPSIAPHIPKLLKDKEGVWKAEELNSWWRVAKYWRGDRFEKHVDGVNLINSLVSKVTVNIYLNEDYAGGPTRLYRGGKPVLDVKGKTGSALLFLQPPKLHLLHDGATVLEGNKYLLRTDVMYRNVGQLPVPKELALPKG